MDSDLCFCAGETPLMSAAHYCFSSGREPPLLVITQPLPTVLYLPPHISGYSLYPPAHIESATMAHHGEPVIPVIVIHKPPCAPGTGPSWQRGINASIIKPSLCKLACTVQLFDPAKLGKMLFANRPQGPESTWQSALCCATVSTVTGRHARFWFFFSIPFSGMKVDIFYVDAGWNFFILMCAVLF